MEYKMSDIGGMGDGEKYTVFRTQKVDEEFLNDFSAKKNQEFENKVNRVAIFAFFLKIGRIEHVPSLFK